MFPHGLPGFARNPIFQPLLLLTLAIAAAGAGPLPSFDFTKPGEADRWKRVNDIAEVRATSEGIAVRISGKDPYLIGPARDYPEGVPLWLRVRLKSEEAGTGQVFYFRDRTTEKGSVRFSVHAGEWVERWLPLPALGTGYRLRVDLPGNAGTAILASLQSESRLSLSSPVWPAPVVPEIQASAFVLEAGVLKLSHNREALGGCEVRVAGQPMAVGHTRMLVGYLRDGEVRWLQLRNSADQQVNVSRQADGKVCASLNCRDGDGAQWTIQQCFAAADTAGVIQIESTVTVDRDREVVFLPMFMLLAGVGSFGEAKGQGLFPGLEYLDNEPSSSEADIVGPASKRQVPDTLKITFPLMAIQTGGRYVGLIWEPAPDFCALFDSPDRTFDSRGHVMGVLFPGSDGINREEGNPLPYRGTTLSARQPLVLRATLIGGLADTMVPAIQQYVKLKGLPPVPNPGMKLDDYVSLAAGGWLDSQIREGSSYRHAVGGQFNPHPAADAAYFQDWLADKTTDTALARRLTEAAKEAVMGVEADRLNSSAVGHVQYPAAALVYGHVAENADTVASTARTLLQRFQPDGSVHYQKPASGLDLGKTHFAPDANGLTAQVVAALLDAAVFSGDKTLIDAALQKLRGLDKYRNGVPRGAQTWEVPLHAPDILASAHLVRAYTLGYELTGDAGFLEQARYWAWTGVPFVYLVSPVPKPIGLYASIPVLGATHYDAVVWMGLPVQWCALVYADALYRLAPHDAPGPWRQLADGITVSGIQQTWPPANRDLQGLLPDSFQLRSQIRNPTQINPGTVQACAVQYFTGAPLYDFHAFRQNGWRVHAPGAIRDSREATGKISFRVEGWPRRPYCILVNGLTRKPLVKVSGKEVTLTGSNQFQENEGRLILQLEDQPALELSVPR